MPTLIALRGLSDRYFHKVDQGGLTKKSSLGPPNTLGGLSDRIDNNLTYQYMIAAQSP
jgi:hypothetical protein